MEYELLNRDEYFAYETILEAKKAYKNGEVPVGSIIVLGDKIIGRGHNSSEEKTNSLFHAEVLAIIQASKNLGTKNLSNATIYTSLEPCMMCLGYINIMKIDRLVYLASDEKYGVCGGWQDLSLLKPFGNSLSVMQISNQNLIEESSNMLSDFFTNIRQNI